MVTGPGWIAGEWEVDAERDLPKLDGVELIFGCSKIGVGVVKVLPPVEVAAVSVAPQLGVVMQCGAREGVRRVEEATRGDGLVC